MAAQECSSDAPMSERESKRMTLVGRSGKFGSFTAASHVINLCAYQRSAPQIRVVSDQAPTFHKHFFAVLYDAGCKS